MNKIVSLGLGLLLGATLLPAVASAQMPYSWSGYATPSGVNLGSAVWLNPAMAGSGYPYPVGNANVGVSYYSPNYPFTGSNLYGIPGYGYTFPVSSSVPSIGYTPTYSPIQSVNTSTTIAGSYCTLAGGGQVFVPVGADPSSYGC